MIGNAYAQAGVNIAEASRAKEMMGAAVRSTFGPEVLSDIGAFGGLFDAKALTAMEAPVLVASTDGVGTKTLVAGRMGRWDSIGRDLVNHCLNDILVQGARPLFFLDYVASAHLDSRQMATIVTGVADACRSAGIALLGGETAEMPAVYQPDAVDLVGTIVGVVDRSKIIDGRRIEPGDVVLGLPSSGLHTNGYSLARRVLADEDWTVPQTELGGLSIGEVLLLPHLPYGRDVADLLEAGIDIRGLSHITGGGLIDNPPRIFPEGVGMVVQRGGWPEQPIFALIQERGNVTTEEMFHVFNMGLGMLVVVPADHVELARETVSDLFLVGEMVEGPAQVTIQ